MKLFAFDEIINQIKMLEKINSVVLWKKNWYCGFSFLKGLFTLYLTFERLKICSYNSKFDFKNEKNTVNVVF